MHRLNTISQAAQSEAPSLSLKHVSSAATAARLGRSRYFEASSFSLEFLLDNPLQFEKKLNF